MNAEERRELGSFEEVKNESACTEVDVFQTCNLSDLNTDTPIFRYVTVDNFYRLLDDEENALAHFSKWEDPFEGFLFKGVAVLSGTKEFVDLHNLYSDYYGQCWTLDGTESDMRWRASACGTRGHLVRIESTIGSLFDSLKLIVSTDWFPVCCRMGQVEYKDEQEIRKLMRSVNLIDEIKAAPSSLLFVKRKEFESEMEFRVVLDVAPCKDPYKAKDIITGISFGNGMAKYKVGFESLVKSVLADPCMARGDFDQLVCRMCQKAPQIHVEQSALFQWPNFVVQA